MIKFGDAPVILTRSQAVRWLKHLFYDWRLSVHPDTPGDQYMFNGGGRVFSDDEAALFDKTMERCAELCDVYKVCLGIATEGHSTVIKHKTLGNHVHCRVFTGRLNNRGKAGEIVLAASEFPAFRECLEVGGNASDYHWVSFEEDV